MYKFMAKNAQIRYFCAFFLLCLPIFFVLNKKLIIFADVIMRQLIIVKSLLKYLFSFLLVVLAFWGGADRSYSMASEGLADDYSSVVASYYSDFSASDSDLYFPPRTYTANAYRLHGSAKRTNFTHKSNCEYIKAGRIISAGEASFIHKESLNIRTSFIEPAQRLIGLGKLII